MRTLSKTLLLCALFTGGAVTSSCGEPSLREYEPRTGIIQGTVLYRQGTARGNVIVLLFRASDPPPPIGSGRPVNFVVVPRAAMFGDAPADEARDFTAPFTIPSVAAGRYQIRAFLDADGDFNPLYDLTGQVTAGDVGGGFVNTETEAFIDFDVAADQVVKNGVLVVLARTIPLERPSFAVTSSTGVLLEDPTYQVPLRGPASLTLVSHPILDRPEVQMDQGRTGFLVTLADDDGDRRPDDANGDQLEDLYPKVLLRRLKTADDQRNIVVPLIIDPLPYRDALRSAASSSVAQRLDLIVPPVAVEISGTMRTILPAAPAGDYEVVVISSTGQTWIVPNNLDVVQPPHVDPTQSVKVRLVDGDALPIGEISGRLEVRTTTPAVGYVIAFREADPPPPAGTGRPVALATVVLDQPTPSGLAGDFVLRGLPPDRYLLSGLYDLDGDFSPLVPVLAQPSAGDMVGAYAGVVQVGLGPASEAVTITLGAPLPVERPAFALVDGPVQLSRRPVPQAFEIVSHPIAALDMDAARTRFLVALAGLPPPDLDGDHLPDLYPRVLLTRLVDGPAPEQAIDDPERIVIPGIVDPLPFLTALSGGAAVVPTDRLRVIVPPLALKLGPSGSRTPIAPIPAGRYRVNVLAPTGQTWSVPSEANTAFGRFGTSRADPTQAEYVEILADPVPLGSISGEVETNGLPLTGDFRVVVFAFSTLAPPPPTGTGRPLASTVLSPGAFIGGRAAYRLSGLAPGRYLVRAFFDTNGTFTPWFDTLNQPDAGDVPGVYLDGGVPGEVELTMTAQAVEGRLVSLIPQQAYTHDRPVFTLAASATVSRNRGGVVRLDSVESSTEVLDATGRFVVTPRDPAAGTVFPQVFAELLDPADPTHLRLAVPRMVIPGLVDAASVGIDPTDPQALAVLTSLPVFFPPVAVDPMTGAPTGQPTAGLYRVTVILRSGQTWTVPNELQRAAGDPLATTQARYLSVVD